MALQLGSQHAGERHRAELRKPELRSEPHGEGVGELLLAFHVHENPVALLEVSGLETAADERDLPPRSTVPLQPREAIPQLRAGGQDRPNIAPDGLLRRHRRRR